MEAIKTSSNVEFEVIYADGTRARVTEGVLFGVEDERIIYHNGTDRPEVVFATFRAMLEIIDNMTAGLPKDVRDKLIDDLLREET